MKRSSAILRRCSIAPNRIAHEVFAVAFDLLELDLVVARPAA